MGLECCLPKRSSITGFEWSRLENHTNQDQRLSSLGLCIVKLEPTLFKKQILIKQIFYPNYEMLVELAVWMTSAHVLHSCYNCWNAGAIRIGESVPLHSFYSIIPIIFALIYSIRAPLQIVYLTGWRAIETKLAVFVGVIAFSVTLLLFRTNMDPLNYNFQTLINDSAVHLQSVLMTVSKTPPKISNSFLTLSMHFALSTVIAALSTGLVLPALRFSQTFLTIVLAPTGAISYKLLAAIEQLYPLALAVVLYPSLEIDAAFKLAAAFGFVLVKICNARVHLQSFLDTVTHSVSIVPEGVLIAADPQIAQKIERRTEYLVAAAAQAVSLPILVLVLCIIYLRYSILGCESCVSFLNLARRDSVAYSQAYSQYATIDATAVTASLASQAPYLYDVIGVMMHSHRQGAKITMDFFFKLARIHLLPPHVIQQLTLALISISSMIWFTLSSCAIAYWYAGPEWIVYFFGQQIALQTQHEPKPIPGGSQADREREAAELAAASASGGRKEGETKKNL